jgi:signal transduction histidine kinase/ligand-binding sensor domain-containing protein
MKTELSREPLVFRSTIDLESGRFAAMCAGSFHVPSPRRNAANLRWLPAVALLLLFVPVCAARSTQYRFDVWTAENGLPQNIVRGIAQSPDGYLWIATLDGLARFDGVRFTVFNKGNTPQIVSNRFNSMVANHNGDLWLMGEGGTLTRFHLGSFHTLGAEDGLPKSSVRAITGDGSENLWVLAEESILQWNEKSKQLLNVTPSNLKIHFEPLLWDNAGFWGWSDSGLHLFVRGHFVTYPLPAGLPGRSIWLAAVDQDGAVWLEQFDGAQFVIPPGQREARRANSGHQSHYSYTDANGHIWTLHMEPRLFRILDVESSGEGANIPFGCFFEDREGNFWIGTEGKGLYRLREQSIQVYGKVQGIVDSNIYPVFEDRGGAVWLGAGQSGLFRVVDGKFTHFTDADGLPGTRVTSLTEDREGRLWVATRTGLTILDHGHFRNPVGIVVPRLGTVQALLQDRGGTMWIGTSNGLVPYRDGPSKTLTIEDGLATNDVRVIVESRSGDVWIGGYGGLTRLRDGQFTRWTERDGLPSNNVRAIHEDADGTIWIGTYDGGLGRFRNGKFTRYRESDGLFNNGVFQILDDGRGNFWMSSNRGIYRVSKEELNAFADGKLANIASVAYGKSDGMLNEECNGGMWPAGIRTRDGKLWFPTQDGVAIVDPLAVHINLQPPPVVIETATVDRAPVSLDSMVKVPPGSESLEIEYTAFSFIHSDQIRFRYIMEGLDSSWIDAGTRRTAYYSHLPPGRYQFHVIARNSDGVWNMEGRSVAVEILAPYYRTWWFELVVFCVAACLILMAMRYRIEQLQRQQALQKAFSQQLIASQESERQRIAAELHDSLGQRLVVINNLALFSMRMREKTGTVENDLSALKEISEETSLAIQETREISYNLRPFQLDRLGLTKAIAGILRSVTTASGLQIASELDDIDDAFPEELRINFYRIVQEALNNIMKHAQSTEVLVKIARTPDRLTLTIRDNGVGFTPGARPSKGGKSGFGLTGMEERAHLLGGELRVTSAPDAGTVLTMEIPLGVSSGV